MKKIRIIFTFLLIALCPVCANSQKNIEKILTKVANEPSVIYSRQVSRDPKTHKVVNEQRSFILKSDKYNAALRNAIMQDEPNAIQASFTQKKYYSLVFNENGLKTTYSIVLTNGKLTVSVYAEKQRNGSYACSPSIDPDLDTADSYASNSVSVSTSGDKTTITFDDGTQTIVYSDETGTYVTNSNDEGTKNKIVRSPRSNKTVESKSRTKSKNKRSGKTTRTYRTSNGSVSTSVSTSTSYSI